ncbi:hypothetical protein [Streptosporangium canum]|uniref:hypothetical protein n=1 Tax=Streptosporangium canum TaxID=324952 RepID=UPI0037A7C61F
MTASAVRQETPWAAPFAMVWTCRLVMSWRTVSSGPERESLDDISTTDTEVLSVLAVGGIPARPAPEEMPASMRHPANAVSSKLERDAGMRSSVSSELALDHGMDFRVAAQVA